MPTHRRVRIHRLVLRFRPGIGRFEIDDVAQQCFGFREFVAPHDDRLEGERTFAEARDHRFAAGLDALGDRDFAFAREQFDRTHFAQIHAHRIVGALARLRFLGGGKRLRAGLYEIGARIVVVIVLFFLAVGIFGFDDIDTHVVHHREHVFDLLGGDFFRRHHVVQLIVGDVAALLGGLDHLLDRCIRKIEQRTGCVFAFGGLLGGVAAFDRRRGAGNALQRFNARRGAARVGGSFFLRAGHRLAADNRAQQIFRLAEGGADAAGGRTLGCFPRLLRDRNAFRLWLLRLDLVGSGERLLERGQRLLFRGGFFGFQRGCGRLLFFFQCFFFFLGLLLRSGFLGFQRGSGQLGLGSLFFFFLFGVGFLGFVFGGHGAILVFQGRLRSPESACQFYIVRAGRPDCAPKPSIRASVPSRIASRS